MEFHDWLLAHNFDPDRIRPDQRTHLQAAWRAEQDPTDDDELDGDESESVVRFG